MVRLKLAAFGWATITACFMRASSASGHTGAERVDQWHIRTCFDDEAMKSSVMPPSAHSRTRECA